MIFNSSFVFFSIFHFYFAWAGPCHLTSWNIYPTISWAHQVIWAIYSWKGIKLQISHQEHLPGFITSRHCKFWWKLNKCLSKYVWFQPKILCFIYIFKHFFLFVLFVCLFVCFLVKSQMKTHLSGWETLNTVMQQWCEDTDWEEFTSVD